MSNISEYERLKPKKTYKALKSLLQEKERQLDFVKYNESNLSNSYHLQLITKDIEIIKDIINKFLNGE